MIDGAVAVMTVPDELTDKSGAVGHSAGVVKQFVPGAVSVKVTVVRSPFPLARNPVPLMTTAVPPLADPEVGVMLLTLGTTG